MTGDDFMLKNRTMRFGTDGVTFSRTSLLTFKQPFDTTGQTSVEGFVISGAEPAGTTRRFLFKVDDKLYKFVNGVPTEYSGAGDFDDVITNGNTAAQLEQVTDIADWLGKKIYPIIALEAPVDAATNPAAKISLRVRSQTELYERTVETAEYDLTAADGATPRIIEITSNIITTGNASASVTCQLQTADGWGNWIELAAAKDCEATAVRFKLFYKVTTLDGSDSAQIKSVTVKHTLGAAAVSGDVAELYSVVKNYQHDLRTCNVVIKHKPLIDSRIEAFVNFMTAPKVRTLIPLGTSTGVAQDLVLGVDGVKDTGIDQNTLHVFADGQPLTNFGYNVEVSRVTVNTTAGKAITASYEYGHDVESWREMSLEVDQQPYDDGSAMTRFGYALPDDEIDGKKLANIRLRLFRPDGHVDRMSLGIANGQVQQFVLPHRAKQETIDVNGDWSYDDDSQILTIVGTKGNELIISFDWLAETQTLYSWTAGFAVV